MERASLENHTSLILMVDRNYHPIRGLPIPSGAASGGFVTQPFIVVERLHYQWFGKWKDDPVVVDVGNWDGQPAEIVCFVGADDTCHYNCRQEKVQPRDECVRTALIMPVYQSYAPGSSDRVYDEKLGITNTHGDVLIVILSRAKDDLTGKEVKPAVFKKRRGTLVAERCDKTTVMLYVVDTGI
jgi:hypothetical protein